MGDTTDLSLDGHHDLDLDSENTSSHVDVSDGNIDELFLWLTSGDLISLSVLLGLCSFSSNLSGNDDLATDGVSSHDTSQDVVDSHSAWDSREELHLEVLTVGSSAEGSVVLEWSHGE